jgi:cytochrome P450
MINDRRAKKSHEKTEGDLIQILIETDFFENSDELILDELITFFIAGMKTIQSTTTNLMLLLEMNPSSKKRLLDEIMPAIEKV